MSRPLFLLVAVALWLATARPTEAAAKWSRIQTEDFVIYSDAAERDLVEFAAGYAAFRHTLRTFFQPKTALPATTLVAFRRQEAMNYYTPTPNKPGVAMVSFSTEVDYDALVAVSLVGDRNQAMELTVEFETAWTLRRLGYFMPIWMSQGTGQVFGSLRVRRNKCIIGDGPARLADIWQHERIIPWARFFDVGYDSPEYLGPAATGMAQAQSWALMHRLLLDDEAGLTRFDALARKLRDTPGLAATEAVLGLPSSGFEKEINAHLGRRTSQRDLPFDDAALRARLKVAPAAEADVRIHLANLLLAARKPTEANAEFAHAQYAAPGSPAVLEWQARRELAAQRPEEAARYYRLAIAAGSRNPAARLTSAEHRMNTSRSANLDRAGGGGADLDDSIEEIRDAIRLNPGNSTAYRLLGRAFFLHPQPTAEHLDELSRGVVPGADDGQVQFYRALLLERLARIDAYLADLRQLATDSRTSRDMQRTARVRIESHEFRGVHERVNTLTEAKQFVAAREAISQARVPSLTREGDQLYAHLTLWLDEVEGWENLRQTYLKQQWRECLAQAQKFLTEFPRSNAAADAREIEQLARRKLDENK